MGSEGSSCGNFATELLRGLDYDNENRIIYIGRVSPFSFLLRSSVAQTDVWIIDNNENLLLLQERLMSMKDLEPRVVAVLCYCRQAEART